MDKYKGKYRNESTRLQNWDYAWAAAYFVTICTKNKQWYFGEVIDGKMQLSKLGVIADILWKEIPYHMKNVELGEYVVMPDHIHGIIILNEDLQVGASRGVRAESTINKMVTEEIIGNRRFQKQGINTLSSIVGAYKSAVSKHARRLGFEFGWQRRYHDHIIRNEKSFFSISEYIATNIDGFSPKSR